MQTKPLPVGSTASMRPAKVILLNIGFCTLVAFFWQMTTDKLTLERFFVGLIYSQCIGNSICILFLLHDRFLCSKRTSQSWLPVLWFPFIVLAGFVFGKTVAELILNHEVSFLDPDVTNVRSLILSIIVTMVIVWYFAVRERLVRMELRNSQQSEQASNAQLSMIRAQVEPHMLFNTLANLRVLIEKNPAQAQLMLDQLIQFLRATLDGSRKSESTLAEEFDVLGNYLALMKIRMADRLTYTLELSDDVKQCKVPALILQPLVENAIKHGLETSGSAGILSVRAQGINGQLHIRVQDNGVGMESSAAFGFGLESVRDRLQSVSELSGKPAELNLQSPVPGQASGTVAEVTLPILSGPLLKAVEPMEVGTEGRSNKPLKS